MRPFRGYLVDRVLGDSAILRGGWAAAEALLAAAEEDARRFDNQQELAHLLRSHATLVLARGGARSAAARSLLGDALARYQWLGMTGRERQSRVRLRTLPSKPLPRPTTPLHAGLSERGASVLRLFSVGRSNREIAYHLAYGPAGAPPAELLRVCDARWQIEEGFAQAKAELGPDHYEVCCRDAWHRFVTLCLLAHAYLAVLCLRARAPGAAAAGAAGEPDLLPLTVPKVRRLVLALAGGAEQRDFHLVWSRWRQRHQAIAARRGRARQSPPATPVTALPTVPGSALTDAEWALAQPLLPPQRPATGRPQHDHPAVFSGMVWVVRRRDSWRAAPQECRKWETVYKRYRRWRAEGRWERVAAAVAIIDAEMAL